MGTTTIIQKSYTLILLLKFVLHALLMVIFGWLQATISRNMVVLSVVDVSDSQKNNSSKDLSENIMIDTIIQK